jgi:iron(II)-dependent oxidoreductase
MMDLKERVVLELETARRRSLGLVDPLSAEEQVRQHSPLMSPLVWDLAHVGNYEELWLLRVLAGMPSTSREYDDMYNPFVHPRFTRANLPLLGPAEARTYIAEVRSRVIDVIEKVEFDPVNRFLAEGFVYGMVVQHEHQHDETMLASRQLMFEDASRPEGSTRAPRGADIPRREVFVDGGPFVMGTSLEPWAYDNERPAHEVVLGPYWIDAAPVTNGDYIRFVEAGGYYDARVWGEAGWEHRVGQGLEHPLYWRREGDGGWSVLRFGRYEDLDPNEPVQHVCWHEADAYARWAGKRLPTEAEWEKAASWDAERGKKRYPWGSDESDGNANLGQRHYGPAGVGAYPGGVSPWGCHQMVGDVWEWTASDFVGYPGYETFPYKEYSEVFFGSEYKVLRGGSWATNQQAIRNTFRNWDFPIRRQIFCGFRCARDA